MKRISNRAAAALIAAMFIVTVAVAVFSPLPVELVPSARTAPQSIFQDDDHLIYTDSATVARTLDQLKALGVDRIRLTIVWADIAPDPTSSTEPTGFDAADPAAYPPAAWTKYDRVVEMAKARGIGVDFDVTQPGPLWATAPVSASARAAAIQGVDEPSAADFGQFVQALGTRYSGTYVPTLPSSALSSILLPSLTSTPGAATVRALPRVAFWSIGNEPNQPGWLAPQWRTAAGKRVPASPMLYRALVKAAVSALAVTGHVPGSDTILIGETAPEGLVSPVRGSQPVRYVSDTGSFDAMSPMVFLRALYCVGSSYRRLAGAAASALGCPARGSARGFVSANPGLFDATGFAHHPYYFLFAPTTSSPVTDYVPLADLGRLEHGLDLIFARYGVGRQIPIYITEYGYQTNPPDPTGVTPSEQATYLNEADYIATRDPRVRSIAQFLLYDAGPDTLYPPSSYQYWGSTFQTGLLYGPGTARAGSQKPAYDAYRLPIWIPDQTTARGAPTLIWGMLRLAPKDKPQQALIQWQPARSSGYHTIAIVDVPEGADFTTRIAAPGTGSIRLAWRSVRGALFTSRAVRVVTSSPLRAGPPGSGQPVPVVILIVLAALGVLSGAGLGIARALGRDPAWAVGWRHSFAEARYRVAAIWAQLIDRFRRRR